MEVVTDAGNTIEIFENDIDKYLKLFCDEQNINDLLQVPQSVWNGALRYIYIHVFKNNRELLKQNNNTTVDGNNIPSNYNAYDYNIILQLTEYYIYLCSIYNKEVSIIGFSNLSGIDTDTINEWGNNNIKLSSTSAVIYKKLVMMREESLANKLADGNKNPVGILAILNRHYQWNLPGVSKESAKVGALSAAELPKLGGKMSVSGGLLADHGVIDADTGSENT